MPEIATDDKIIELINLVGTLIDAGALDRAVPEVRAKLEEIAKPYVELVKLSIDVGAALDDWIMILEPAPVLTASGKSQSEGEYRWSRQPTFEEGQAAMEANTNLGAHLINMARG